VTDFSPTLTLAFVQIPAQRSVENFDFAVIGMLLIVT
jgi:hypothetical protein